MMKYYSGTYNYEGVDLPEGGNMANKPPSNDVRDKVNGWLMEDGWKLQKHTLPDASWAFIAEDPNIRRIVVGQKVGRDDQLLLQAAVIPDENVMTQLDKLAEDERNNFLWDLRFELLRAGIDFNGVGIPFKRVEVMMRITTDALTKDVFVQRLGQVHKGVILVQWMTARKFAKPEAHGEIGFRTQT